MMMVNGDIFVNRVSVKSEFVSEWYKNADVKTWYRYVCVYVDVSTESELDLFQKHAEWYFYITRVLLVS